MKSEQLDNVKKLNKEEKKSSKYVASKGKQTFDPKTWTEKKHGTSDGHMVSHPKVKSEGKPMKFYKQKGREGKVHVGAMKE